MNNTTPSRFILINHFIPKVVKSLLLLVFCFFNMAQSYGQSLPGGFEQVKVAHNILLPTAMAFAPDGRIFVAQQGGKLRIVKNGSLLKKPFLTLKVDSTDLRGLLGIAFDPDFNSNHYIYLYFTLASGANNRVSRFTANGDEVVPGSQHVILDLDPLSSGAIHNGGNLQFGLDGKLYIAVGNNSEFGNSQDLNTNLGKVLRINKSGTIPASNPFKTGSAKKRSIWSYGMRNPYTLAVDLVSGRIFANDVGGTLWEEINNITNGGGNYGWPMHEGYSNQPGYRSPVYAYAHGTSNTEGCAITGGTFFKPANTSFPAKYYGNYFFIDFCGSWINRLIFNGSSVTRAVFATNISGCPVGLITGPDGNLYYLSRIDSALYRIKYTSPNSPVSEQEEDITGAEAKSITNTDAFSSYDFWDLMKIYPNPAGDYFTAEIPADINECMMRIYNTEGSLVKEFKSETNQQVSTADLNNGTYMVIVENRYAVMRKRLIIQK